MRKLSCFLVTILCFSAALVHAQPGEISEWTVWDEEFLLPPGESSGGHPRSADVITDWCPLFTQYNPQALVNWGAQFPLEDLPLW